MQSTKDRPRTKALKFVRSFMTRPVFTESHWPNLWGYDTEEANDSPHLHEGDMRAGLRGRQ